MTTDIAQDQRERGIVVDNAFRPGKGSRPRPLTVSKTEYVKQLERIFKWKRRK
jgi:hypothetical protein